MYPLGGTIGPVTALRAGPPALPGGGRAAHGGTMRTTLVRLALVAVVGFTVAGCGTRNPAPPGASATPTSSSSRPEPSTPPSSATPTPTVTPTPGPPSPSGPPSTPSNGALRLGATGPEVLALQQRLRGLGYWLDAVDGAFGPSTMHAVVAFQKASGLPRDGVAGRATLALLARASRLEPRSRSGRLIEVDLRHQLLLVVADGRVLWVLDTSTGAVPGTTPRGYHTVTWQVDGYRVAPLGVLYRPKYFVGGVAVHGFSRVPPYPASHGCVRVTNAAMDMLWARGLMPIGSTVWVY